MLGGSLPPFFLENEMAKNENRKSVYFSEPIWRLLGLVGEENYSGVINQVADRYLTLMEVCRPTLSKNEWCCLCDILNGTVLDSMFIRHAGEILALELNDAIKHDQIDKKWDIDGPALLEKLSKFNKAETIAVAHVVEVFWHNCKLDRDEAFTKAGLKFKE